MCRHWFQQAAPVIPEAMYKLAQCLEDGWGGVRDPKEAFKLYNKSAMGNDHGQHFHHGFDLYCLLVQSTQHFMSYSAVLSLNVDMLPDSHSAESNLLSDTADMIGVLMLQMVWLQPRSSLL